MSLMNGKITAWMVNAGAVVALALTGAAAGQATQQAKLLAGDGDAIDNFGNSVAIDGDYAIVGSEFQEDIGAANTGAAYIYRNDSVLGWILQAKLTASAADRQQDDNFGVSVAISGNVAVVGAFQDGDSGSSSGSAYVFRRTGTSWAQEAKLLASDGAMTDNFGVAVAIDGDVIAVGAIGADSGGVNRGAVYVFRLDESAMVLTWPQEVKLVADPGDAADGDALGRAVAVSGDTVIAGTDTESAFIFSRSGSTWSQQAELTAGADAQAGALFGTAVSISGNSVVVGARLADDIPGDNSGAAYVFERDDDLVWAQTDELTAFTVFFGLITISPVPNEEFGSSVAINGNRIAIGVPQSNDQQGATYIFSRSGDAWSELAKLDLDNVISPPVGLETGDQFGNAISLSGNSKLVVGSIGDDDNGSSAGAAYVFSITAPSSDSDGDGIDDDDDNCPSVANADQLDTDGDDLGNACDPDDDNDGLTDAQEAIAGTNPLVVDTDVDGLTDFQEVDAAMGSSCPDPLDADSDVDGLSDGAEVNPPVGTEVTNPCNADTDGDGVNDHDDPLPIDPGVTEDFLAEWAADVASGIGDMDLGLFSGPNQIVQLVRRNTLALLTFAASLLIDNGNYAEAHALLSMVESRIDNDPSPSDWMANTPARAELHGEINLLLALLQLLE